MRSSAIAVGMINAPGHHGSKRRRREADGRAAAEDQASPCQGPCVAHAIGDAPRRKLGHDRRHQVAGHDEQRDGRSRRRELHAQRRQGNGDHRRIERSQSGAKGRRCENRPALHGAFGRSVVIGRH